MVFTPDISSCKGINLEFFYDNGVLQERVVPEEG